MMIVPMTRRRFLEGVLAGSIVAVSGCAYNESLGRSQLILVSDDQLSQLGEATWKDIKAKERLSRDRGKQRMLERAGQRCVDAAGQTQYNWEFAVFDNPQINAFAVPGGKVGFYSGIFDVMDNEAHVAAVTGHEVGHIAARHSAERYSQQVAAGALLAVAAAGLAASDVRYRNEIAAVLGAGVTYGVILPYSRAHEYEADRLGVTYMANAGYQPAEAVDFWQNMTKLNQARPLEFMSTHPSDESRIAAMQAQVSRLQA
jgi:predicted Zn-dependent protease